MSPTRVAMRRPGRRIARERPPGRANDGVATDVDIRIQQLDRISIRATGERAARLVDAAEAEPARVLPYLEVLERRFGQDLGWICVRQGGLVDDTLDALGASAATRGHDIFVREPSPSLDVLSHEVVHALQARKGGTAGGVLAEGSAPEVEAAQSLHAPVRPAEGLAPGAIALLRRNTPPGQDQPISLHRTPGAALPTIAAPAAQPPVTAQATAESARTGRAGGVPSAETTPGPGTEASTAAGTEAGAETGEAFTLPPAGELTVSAEEVAAREEALAASEAALAGAGSASDLLGAFADAPPTVKARQAAALTGHLAEVVPAETAKWQDEVPSIDADLRGTDGPPPAPLRVEAPPAADVELEPEAVAPAPEPDLGEVPEAQPFTENDGVASAFGRLTEPAPEQLAEVIGDSLDDVQTTDPSVPRSPGPPPVIPLEGETDPARIAGQEDAANTQAAQLRDDAARAVVDGPGPERVQPTSVRESHEIEAVAAAPTAAVVVPEGPDAYLALGLPPEVQVAFDETQQLAMRGSMAEATAGAEAATLARDTARDEAVNTAQEGAARLNAKAQTDQTTAVSDARSKIQTERQSTIDAQHAEVGRVRGEAAERRKTDEGTIDRQVGLEQQEIDKSYAAAETDIAAKVSKAERDAEEERAKAEREAENQSWWDRAVDFVKDAFDALVSVIGDIFDAVRDLVNKALDAVKAFALSVIDRLATFVKDAIAAFGEFLKFAVNALIGEIFPELAAELNAAIDEAVADAQAAVDTVADTLKAGINALVEGLRAGINAALNTFAAAITMAVSVVGAALTGDWAALARKVLEAVLKLVGVDPESFYAFVGRAQDTFDLIINDPFGFLSNIVSAVVGGVQGFADRFGNHLKAGVIGWLTGTLGSAGITLPQTFDLMGVLDLARQILGLTWERLRAKAVKLVGEENVARLEYIGGYITTLVTEGWSALWERLKADLGGLVDMVFDGIKSFLLERVVLAMIKKIPALFGPVGAIVQLVMTAWNLYTFLRDQLARIAELVRSVVDTIGDIARGVLTAAIAKVEEVLGNLVPVALDLLARILGLGNLGEDVRKVVEKIQDFLDKAIDALITRVLGLFTGKGKADAAAPTVAGAGAEAALPDAADADAEGPLEETLHIAGEDHTLRAVGPGGDATLEMASGPFDKLVGRMNKLVKQLKQTYTNPQGAKYVGPTEASDVNVKLDAIATGAQSLVDAISKETSKAKERKLIRAGFAKLREDLTALNLPEATTTVLHAHHAVHAGPADSYTRQSWFEVNPLVPESTKMGGQPSGPTPGVKVHAGYHRGHLVAKSLGGPGTPDNLVAMSAQSNTSRVGVVGVEDSLRYALGKFLKDYPEAKPGYAFSYRVTANYRPDGGLQRDLASHQVARNGSEDQLFRLAQTATSEPMPADGVRAAIVHPSGPNDQRLLANVARRVMWFFAPASISADVQVLKTPDAYSAPIYQSATAPNHLGVDLDWEG